MGGIKRLRRAPYKYYILQGDWELRTDVSPVPVKLTVKQFIGSDWMVACMVPKGNMMHCMLREVDGAIKQLKYNITGKEIPVEIMEIETTMSQFFEGEINDIKREGLDFLVQNTLVAIFFCR